MKNNKYVVEVTQNNFERKVKLLWLKIETCKSFWSLNNFTSIIYNVQQEIIQQQWYMKKIHMTIWICNLQGELYKDAIVMYSFYQKQMSIIRFDWIFYDHSQDTNHMLPMMMFIL